MKQLLGADGWKGAEELRPGGDSKWQRNRYERGGIPLDIMEFTTLKEPCCWPCAAAHCGSNQ